MNASPSRCALPLSAAVWLAGCGGGGGTSPPPSPPMPADAEMVFMTGPIPGAEGVNELATMRLDGTRLRQLTGDGRNKFLPHFSPDGTRVLYSKFLSGHYADPLARTEVAVYDLARGTETLLTALGNAFQPVWSPDGRRIAFGTRAGDALWLMNADGSAVRRLAGPSGLPTDLLWGDFVWSNDDWIIFTVAQNVQDCLKVRIDKIRPDGSARTQVSDGGPNCTPEGKEQSGDADPGVSPDGQTIYSSRGFPTPPAGGPAGATERRLYAFASTPWTPGKPERDLSLPSEPSCVEGVPKPSPDGQRVLLFRACFGAAPSRGIFITDTAGSYRRKITDGFGPDWHPGAR